MKVNRSSITQRLGHLYKPDRKPHDLKVSSHDEIEDTQQLISLQKYKSSKKGNLKDTSTEESIVKGNKSMGHKREGQEFANKRKLTICLDREN
ncbi:hypothetical protein C0J52_01810 [Blattella germanica]|nr:hypothetical protein C0J52_01810 [Blattella germanica]